MMNLPQSSNLTNKYNPQEPVESVSVSLMSSNLTNKYNPQEQELMNLQRAMSSNLTNKYNPQEQELEPLFMGLVQILPINTILKNLIQLTN